MLVRKSRTKVERQVVCSKDGTAALNLLLRLSLEPDLQAVIRQRSEFWERNGIDHNQTRTAAGRTSRQGRRVGRRLTNGPRR